ncbi:MAG: TolC family protein [Bacteroidales bacterium]|nr:TolC family protein [Bacteroidales bacterium]
MLACCFLPFAAAAQEHRFTPVQLEAIFLKQNLELIAEQMNISIADAAIAEAKVWDNPQFFINDINVWRTGYEKQFSLELTQMVSLSARRAKLANVEKVGKEIMVKAFEELLRGLKMELRSSVAELVYLQSLIQVYEAQKSFLESVITAYNTQYERGNISRSELLRLQAALFEMEGEINDTQIDFNALQKTLKNLLAIEPAAVIVVMDEHYGFPSPFAINPLDLIQAAIASRPDLQAVKLQSEYHRNEVIYQKSLTMPDLHLGVNYDRHGGVWNHFLGVGMGLQVPLFNRNRGGIKTAQIQLRQNEVLVEQGQKALQNEVIESYQNYLNTYTFLERSLKNPALSQLDDMLEVYARNLIDRNISMVEYMDFMDSYRSTKEMLLKSQKELRLYFEQLRFVVGNDID